MIMPDYLRDKEFLKTLDSQKQREVFASITSLNFKEEILEEITGRVTSGSVSIDGKSAVRRTCSLSLVAEELNIHDYYWGLKTKFLLSIGLRNAFEPKYPDIIWFPMGTYVISSFNTSQATNNYTISIQGKDKMSLLNGDLGGSVTALSHDFGKFAQYADDGTYTLEDIPLKQIIIDAVHTFANEPYENIIVNDLDESGVELMEYRGNKPLYMLYNEETQEVEQMTINGDHGAGATGYKYKQWDSELKDYPTSWSSPGIGIGSDKVVYNTLADELDMEKTIHPTLFFDGTDTFSIIKVEQGQTAGYRMCDLIYAGDLIVPVGTAITSGVLDKIKNMLGDYEYFYNLEGKFVFQRKKTFVNVSWNNEVKNEDSETYYDNVSQTSATTYFFEDAQLVTSFSNAPALANLKNDFSIWGERESSTGAKIPVHLRYAIDTKPCYYTSYKGDVTYTTKTKEEVDKDIAEGDIDVSQGYVKVKNPIFAEGKQPLSEDWWDAYDWAEYYKACTGDYPKERIRAYTQQTRVDLSEHFAKRFDRDGTVSDNVGTLTYATDTLFTIDGAFYEAHGHCTHYYEEHLQEWQKQGQQIFVYKPELPEEIKNQEGVELIPIGSSVQYELDWRELIYQMAIDYLRFGHEDDFLSKIAANNPKYCPLGYTGYEQYYTDIQGFWRTLYDPTYWASFEQVYVTKTDFDTAKKDGKANYYFPQRCTASTSWSKTTQFLKKVDPASDRYEPVFFESAEKWNEVKDKTLYFILIQVKADTEFNPKEYYYQKIESEYEADHWHKTVYTAPHMLNFWFDFLDSEEVGELGQFSVKAVGARPKAENDNNVKAIYFRDTPNVIFVDATITAEKLLDMKNEKTGYTFARLPGYFVNLFSISAQGKSAFDVLNNHLYNYSYCAETITLNALPVYYLEPNTRIFVKDDNSNINGEYIVERITIPLQYNGTMSISATKATERLY